MNKGEKKLLGHKLKRSKTPKEKKTEYNGEDVYIFSNQNNSLYTVKFISKYENFIEIISKLKNPSYTTDTEFLYKSSFFVSVNNKDNFNKELDYIIPINNIDKSKIFPLENPEEFFKNDMKLQTCNFIFSNNFEDEEIIFDTIHSYCNNDNKESYISRFCPDYLLHFPNNNIDKFYEIKQDDNFLENIKAINDNSYGICHFYSPKRTGKSILFRSILTNFINNNAQKSYIPIMFFNIKLLYNLILDVNIPLMKKIILHESYFLFQKREDSKELISAIDFTEKNVMKLILEIINIIIKQMIVIEKKIFILDGYSYEYDRQNILKEIKYLVYERKNIFLEIIYDINNLKDSEILYRNINPENHVNSNTKCLEKYYYVEKIRKFSDIKKYFAKNEIPKNYKKIFSENISYFFEYKKNKNITFEDFVKKKRNKIKKEMIVFSTFKLKSVLKYIEKKKNV